MHMVTVARGSAPKAFRGGTHRLVPPWETLGRVRRFFGVMGITRVANVTGLDCIGIPVVMVCRPNSRSLSVAQGKGLDLATATASGVMESIEGYHAERITLPLKLATYEELRYTHHVADVERLPPCAAGRFDANLPILLIEGQDLVRDEPVWVPYEAVHTQYTVSLAAIEGCFLASSSGLASGNHRLEAISHAICEVVERDACTLAHLLSAGDVQAVRLDLNTVDDPACREALEKYDRAGVAVAVWDVTSDIGIPAFECMISDREENPGRLLYSSLGSGCHPDRGIALLRALTEAAQSRLTLISGARDDAQREKYERYRNPEVLRAGRALIENGAQLRRFHEVPTFAADTFDEDVAWEVDRLRAAGCDQVIVVDLTRPEFQVPVVRVLVPGLEGKDEAQLYVPGARARIRREGAA